jgi:hypothetical protein
MLKPDSRQRQPTVVTKNKWLQVFIKNKIVYELPYREFYSVNKRL